MDMPNNAISALPITDKLQARATAIAAVKEQIVPLREMETITARPCYNDAIIGYAAIDGIGRPDNFTVQQSVLWEQEALDAWQALQDAATAFQQYFESYGFPEKPVEETPPEVQPSPAEIAKP